MNEENTLLGEMITNSSGPGDSTPNSLLKVVQDQLKQTVSTFDGIKNSL